MAVKIRLQRHGRKKRPFYRLVAADARAQRDGVFLERLGYYNPLTKPAEISIDEEKALKWLRRGAQPTDTAKSLLSKRGILMKFEDERLGRPTPTAAVEEQTAETDETDDAQPSDAEAGSLLTEATPEVPDTEEA